MTMAHSIGNYFMIPVYILCIALFYPVLGDDELIHNVTAQGVYGEEAVLTCIFKKTEVNVRWTFDGHEYSLADATATTTTEAVVPTNGSTTSTKVTVEAAAHDRLTSPSNDTVNPSTPSSIETTDPSSVKPFEATDPTSITSPETEDTSTPTTSIDESIPSDSTTPLDDTTDTYSPDTPAKSTTASRTKRSLPGTTVSSPLTSAPLTAETSPSTYLNDTVETSTLVTAEYSSSSTSLNDTAETPTPVTAESSSSSTSLNGSTDTSTPITTLPSPTVMETSETNSGTTTVKPPSRHATIVKGNQFILKITNPTEVDALNYTCSVQEKSWPVYLNLSFPGKLVTMQPSKDNIDFKLISVSHENTMREEDRTLNLTCVFEVYNETDVEWIVQLKGGNKTLKGTTIRNKKQLISTYTSKMHLKLYDEQNGKYVCRVKDPHTGKILSGEKDVKIIAAPSIAINFTKPVSSSEIFFNWTVKNFNSEIKGYELSYRNSTTTNFQFIQNADEKINITTNYYVLKHLSSNTTYILRLRVKTFTDSEAVEFSNRTLAEDPDFVPNISINGFTARSMTIGMSAPPPDVAEHVNCYVLQVWKKNDPTETTKEAIHYRDERNLPYMFNDLNPHTTYVFKAKACFEFGDTFKFQRCGNWSNEMEAITMDGIPNGPNMTMVCGGSVDQGYHVNLTWLAPTEPNAEIKGYMMELTGNSSYIDRFGQWKVDTFGPLSKFLTNVTFFTRVLDLKPNMNYTARLMALTRSRRRGQETVRKCLTDPAPPDSPPRPRWRKIEEKDGQDQPKYSLRVLVPRVPERNGPICCYRVYLVQLPKGKGWIPTLPQDLPVITRDFALTSSSDQEGVGAYVTDIFDHTSYPTGDIPLGDNKSLSLPRTENTTCARCFEIPQRQEPPTTVRVPTTTDDFDDVTDTVKTRRSADSRVNEIKPQDPVLNPYYNYTLFVELIPAKAEHPSLYSGYTAALNNDTPAAIAAANTMETALQISCGVAAFLLLGTLIFCIVHTRRARKQPPRHAHVELNPIQAALRYVVGHIGGRTPLVSTPPDLPPIALEDLAAAYAERQADSDYGFQKEFELLQMLPECYPDRTTHASEARENQPKNRYPDIKAYDQTRVQLQQIDGIAGSDYINANYVMGYKLKQWEKEKVATEGYWENMSELEEYDHREHKQFICAQGPTDTTVNDFWRMIWEGGLELIVMLTNLEEYSKVKCSKYWPDEDRGSRAFGSITVHHVSEKRYSDYIVRELKIVKQATNSDGQPIVENNGIAKRNGDCKDAESGSVPTSPRELKENNTRIVRQYHFLMWKDFAAPEHPQSILKFIKRMNEAWSNLMGRPVVVHCSAGVGRTGTLVALDCLLEQLRNSRRAAVFSTVAELRRQRNFLVQSLKQYVFVYRALVEYAHYGDTELPASRLKAAVDRLRNTPEGAAQCLMEHEFQKMMNPPVSEPLKSCSAGSAEEARARNRSNDCLPYDRNRVILAPAPPANYSTYINASFIEAYDNSEGYIITQDPLPNTITDFWRMVSEHNVATIVMLSELGEGKCPRYWDDGTAQYDHISVQYEESESCPYYTRRQFRVTNNKSGDTHVVRQLQYHGWPTAPGHVPEVTRGLAELADAARADHADHPTMVLHCQYGTERSALFAALCILICALRTEHRVDVAATARKVRSQRAGTINTFLQYEFLHRAILNYAELHNLLEDS